MKGRNGELKIDGEIDEWVIQMISRREKSFDECVGWRLINLRKPKI